MRPLVCLKMKRRVPDDGQDRYCNLSKRPKSEDVEDEKIHTLAVICNLYDKPFPYFRKPLEIGSFSQDKNRTFQHDRRQLRFYIKPVASDPSFDLRRGYTSLVRKDDSVKEYLDDMLRWIMMNKVKFALQSEKEHRQGTGIERCRLHTHTHTHTCTCTHTHTRVYKHVYTRACTHTCTHFCTLWLYSAIMTDFMIQIMYTYICACTHTRTSVVVVVFLPFIETDFVLWK